MSEVFLLWAVFTVIPNISALFGISFTILALLGGCVAFYNLVEGNSLEEVKAFLKPFVFYIKVILMGFLLSIFIPSSDQMKIIIGGYFTINTVQAVGDIEGIERIPANVVKAMNKFLEEQEEDE